MEGFDPYRKWLGIPSHEQPPNHYRLLGIGLFESDPDVIASAADRQMSHVRSFLSGQYAGMAQFVLNELAAARMCLLDPQQKAQYDLWLQQAMPMERQMPPLSRMAPMPSPQVPGYGPGMYSYPPGAAPAPTPSNVPWASPAPAGGNAGQATPAGQQSPGMYPAADDPLAIGASYSSAAAGPARHGRAVHGKKKDDGTIIGIAFALVGVSVLIVIIYLSMVLSSGNSSNDDQRMFGPPVPVIIKHKHVPANSSESKPAATSGASSRSDRGNTVAHKSPSRAMRTSIAT